MAHEFDIGILAQPGNGYRQQLSRWPYWAADNGCFAQGPRFDLDAFLAWLEACRPNAATCLFAAAPDVMQDAAATTARSLPILPQIRALGFPAAYVAQNGLTVATTPWGAFDALFIGGDTQFKLGHEVQPIISEAKRRGIWVHSGRVNSLRRLQTVALQGCDSADGTYLKFGPDVNLPKVLHWLRCLREQPSLALWTGSDEHAQPDHDYAPATTRGEPERPPLVAIPATRDRRL